MILITQQYNVAGELPAGQFIVQNVDAATEIGSAAFTQMALLSVFGNFGQIFVGIALFFFAFTTILAYYYITETNVAYLNRVFNNKLPVVLFKLLLMFMVAYGTVNSAGYIWNIGDIGVGLMAWVNVVGILAIFFMYKPTMRCLRDYEEQKKNGGPISFDPVRLGIKNATFWENKLAKQQAELQQKDKQ
jgi:AGCS family alanine or glycine:cation symporter